MQPWRHAKVTARQMGAGWSDHLPVHEFMDLAKVACPDLRHRAVLHNADFGPWIASRRFPRMPEAAQIAREHVRQDLKALPTLADWLGRRSPAVPTPLVGEVDRSEILLQAAEFQGLASTDPVDAVWELLMSPVRFAGRKAKGLLLNGFGPVLVRAVLGPAREEPGASGSSVVFDPSWCAEGLIVAHCDRLPDLRESLAAIRLGGGFDDAS